MMRSWCVLCFCVLFTLCPGVPGHAQSFDLEQFEQIFRPRLKVDARWMPQQEFLDGKGHYEERSAQCVLTFPLYKRWSVGVDLDNGGDGVKKMLKNAVRVRASQVMGNARYGHRRLMLDDGTRLLHSASLGALGVRLTRTYRVLFWSVNVNISEEEETFDRLTPRFDGLIGQLHVKGLRRQFFYGVAATVSDGLNLPLPFVGGAIPLADRWVFRYILPLQVAIGSKASPDLGFQIGAGADGYRSGFAQGDDRVNINYTAFRVFANMRHRLSRHFQLRAELSTPIVHGLRLPDADGDRQRYAIDPGLQFNAGVNIFFGGSTLERLLDEVLK